jgi:putative two-component system response regulator
MNTSEVTRTRTTRPMQKVVVVNGAPDVLELLESVLDGGRYDLLFADASTHAYSLIAREQPHLVVLCTSIDRFDGFQLLSMLKLDPRTRDIPVVTYTTESEEDEEVSELLAESDDDGLPAAPPMTLH